MICNNSIKETTGHRYILYKTNNSSTEHIRLLVKTDSKSVMKMHINLLGIKINYYQYNNGIMSIHYKCI